MTKDNYVIVAGTFDLFHKGHVELLRRARQFGRVIALVNTDKFVKKFKKITPNVNEEERADVVDVCKYVNMVFYNPNADLKKTINPLLRMYPIKGVVFGDDYDIEKYRAQTKITPEWQALNDIALIQFPRTPGVSSSQIRKAISPEE